jgi:hypothetical protein
MICRPATPKQQNRRSEFAAAVLMSGHMPHVGRFVKARSSYQTEVPSQTMSQLGVATPADMSHI